MPVIIHNVLQSVRLLSDAIHSFHANCAEGIAPNHAVIKRNMESSLMLVTALNPYIGYDQAAKIAKAAYKCGMTLRKAAVQTGILTEEQFDAMIDPKEMVHPSL